MRAPLVALLTLTPGCSGLADSYGKEYVLYDSNRDSGATATPAPDPDDPEGSFARVRELEAVHGEIERAILDGLDADGRLAAKRREVEAELAELTRDGDWLRAARERRVPQLLAFPVRSPDRR